MSSFNFNDEKPGSYMPGSFSSELTAGPGRRIPIVPRVMVQPPSNLTLEQKETIGEWLFNNARVGSRYKERMPPQIASEQSVKAVWNDFARHGFKTHVTESLELRTDFEASNGHFEPRVVEPLPLQADFEAPTSHARSNTVPPISNRYAGAPPQLSLLHAVTAVPQDSLPARDFSFKRGDDRAYMRNVHHMSPVMERGPLHVMNPGPEELESQPFEHIGRHVVTGYVVAVDDVPEQPREEGKNSTVKHPLHQSWLSNDEELFMSCGVPQSFAVIPQPGSFVDESCQVPGEPRLAAEDRPLEYLDSWGKPYCQEPAKSGRSGSVTTSTPSGSKSIHSTVPDVAAAPKHSRVAHVPQPSYPPRIGMVRVPGCIQLNALEPPPPPSPVNTFIIHQEHAKTLAGVRAHRHNMEGHGKMFKAAANILTEKRVADRLWHWNHRR